MGWRSPSPGEPCGQTGCKPAVGWRHTSLHSRKQQSKPRAPRPGRALGVGWGREGVGRGPAPGLAPTLGLRGCGLPAWVWWSEAIVDRPAQE